MPTFSNAQTAGHRDGHHQERRPPDRPRPSDHPLHRRRRHRPGHLARQRARLRRRGRRRPTAASGRSPGWKSSPARRRSSKFNNWLPDDTVEAFQHYLVGIKGPLTTPVGGGIRSLNVALRQMLDLYVCLRPVRYFTGVPSPVKHPEKVDMVIFRENTEDIYAGIEYAAGTPEAQKVLDFLQPEVPQGVQEDPLRHDRGGRGMAEAARRHRRRRPRRRRAGRHRHQAGQLPRHRAARPQRHRLRHQAQAQERHARAQGQHHEVHRRRLPRLGLQGRQEVLRRRRDRRRPVVQDPRRQARRGPRHQGRDRRHHAPAGADAPRGLRRHRHARTSTATTCATRWPRRSAASASPPAATSTTSPATPSSKPPTAPPRSTPTRTSSTPAASSSPA